VYRSKQAPPPPTGADLLVANELSPGPERNRSKDADLTRSFVIGCGILFVLYLCGSGLIAWFWMNR
jgi:hypothetical protein